MRCQQRLGYPSYRTYLQATRRLGVRCQSAECFPRRLTDIQDDQALWRQLHLEAYDNPFQAAAFLEPRSSYPWREVIIERNVVARYLQTGALTKFTSSGLLRHLAQNIGLVFYSKPGNEADADYVFAMEEVVGCWGRTG